MSALLNKRLSGILGAGLVALAVGVAGTPAAAATASGSADAQVSGLTKKQKKKKKKELKNCDKKSTKKKVKKCKKQVNKKYKKIAKNNTPKGKTYGVVLGDNYYAPSAVNLKVNDLINWKWTDIGGFEPHDVTLVSGPSGVSRGDYKSAQSANKSFTFKRAFVKPGTYNFQCSLHFLMTMTVKVSK